MRFFIIFFVTCWFWVATEAAPKASEGETFFERQLQEEKDFPLPSCERLIKERELCKKLREARARAEAIALTIVVVWEEQASKWGKKPVLIQRFHRQFGLVAYDPIGNEWHEIVLTMPLAGNSIFQPVVVTEHNPPYQVTRIKGQTFNKMLYAVKVGARDLYVYASKHLLVPATFRGKEPRAMKAEAEEIVYLATPPYLVKDKEELARLGKEYVLEIYEEVLRDLREAGVVSKAYPGRLVADVSSREVPLVILSAEQTDPCLLQVRDRGCIHLVPQSLYERDEQVIGAVLTEFVLNGLYAYRHICSSAAACGAHQFTNNPTHNFGGTYNMVRAAYPRASLDPVFRRGAQGFRNSAKAAVLLIDLELSSRAVPDWVRVAFLEDQRLGSLMPGGAYNGGASQSKRLAGLLVEYSTLQKSTLSFETFPWQSFFSWAKGREILKGETLGYVQKIAKIWKYLAELGNRTVPEPDQFGNF